MAVTFTFKHTGWTRKSERLRKALKFAPRALIGPKDPRNIAKAKASVRRGDSTFTLRHRPRERAARLIARGMKAIVVGANARTFDGVMKKVGTVIATDLRKYIKSGLVQGPRRSRAWNLLKGHNKKMIGLTKGPGKFVRNIKARLER